MSKNSQESPVTLKEHLSAMLDGEAGSFEQQRMISQLEHDRTLQKQFATFALIGECMRSSDAHTLIADSDFLAGIQTALDQEPDYTDQQGAEHSDSTNQKQPAESGKSWLRPIGGFAAAASIAALAVIGVQNYWQKQGDLLPGGSSDGLLVSAVSSDSVVPPKNSLSVEEMNSAVVVSADVLQQEHSRTAAGQLAVADTPVNEYRMADGRARNMLKHYVDSHMQHASVSAFVPTVRLIAYSD